jgi:CBS domain-containing protein
MTTPVVSVTPDTPISTALLLATQHGWKRLPVCGRAAPSARPGEPQGTVTRGGTLKKQVSGGGVLP